MALNLKREEEHEEGAPGWMVTYGDMMSLLLCFFIMLVAMSEIKDEKFERLLDSVRRAFGYTDGIEISPGPMQKSTSMYDHPVLVQALRGNNGVGGSETVNIHGREFTCRNVREGLLITVGGKFGFEAGSVEIPDALKKDLDALVTDLSECANRVLIRGHVSTRDALQGHDDWQLAWRRAEAVKDYLVKKGINPVRMRLSSCGRSDPVGTNLTAEGRAANRRVEIVLSEQVVTDEAQRRTQGE